MRIYAATLVSILSAALLGAAPNLSHLPLTFEPGIRSSEFVARSGGLTMLVGPAGVTTPEGRMRLIGARANASVQPEERLAGYSNYLTSSDPKKWRTHVPNYSRVRYRGVYPGIDVVYYGSPRELEFDFVIAPGADARRIQIELSNPDLRIRLPRIYQDDRAVKGRAIRRGNRVTFELAAYDRSRPLIIDPVLKYAAIFGGASLDEGKAIAVDSAGAAYIAGNAFDGNFPVVNGQPGRFSFVAKLTPAGDALVFSTYLPPVGGGSAVYAIDASGSVYLTRDGAPPFPLIGPPPLRNCSPGPADVYVAKLNPDGASMVYSGCIGGSQVEFPRALAIDTAGNAYVTGFTQSADFPLLNPLQNTHPGGNGFLEGFVLKFGPDGTLIYSTFLGAGMGDLPRAIAADAAGNVYVTGQTGSANFPLKNAIQAAPQGPFVNLPFITKIKADGSDLVYSTFFGGTNDAALAIAADAAGNTYIGGSVLSGQLPVTKNALQTKLNSAFAFKTTDGAANWMRSDSGLSGSTSNLKIDPNNTSTLYAIGVNSILKSSDRGATWQSTSVASPNGIWIDPADSTLFVSTLKGMILRSHDAGLSFTTIDTGVPGRVNEIVSIRRMRRSSTPASVGVRPRTAFTRARTGAIPGSLPDLEERLRAPAAWPSIRCIRRPFTRGAISKG